MQRLDARTSSKAGSLAITFRAAPKARACKTDGMFTHARRRELRKPSFCVSAAGMERLERLEVLRGTGMLGHDFSCYYGVPDSSFMVILAAEELVAEEQACSGMAFSWYGVPRSY